MAIILPELKSTAMSLAQQLREEGRLEGHLEGKLEGLHKGMINLLGLRFQRVPEGLQEAIREIADEARLMELHAVILQVSSMEEFAAAL